MAAWIQEKTGEESWEEKMPTTDQHPPGLVVQKVDKAFNPINHYPADGAICFVNNYPLYSNLSSG